MQVQLLMASTGIRDCDNRLVKDAACTGILQRNAVDGAQARLQQPCQVEACLVSYRPLAQTSPARETSNRQAPRDIGQTRC